MLIPVSKRALGCPHTRFWDGTLSQRTVHLKFYAQERDGPRKPIDRPLPYRDALCSHWRAREGKMRLDHFPSVIINVITKKFFSSSLFPHQHNYRNGAGGNQSETRMLKTPNKVSP